MMEILRGSPALSAFRINKLLARFQAANLQVHNIYAEYVHFADLNAPLNEDEHAQLARLLKYGPALQSHARKENCCWLRLALAPSPRGLLKRLILPTTAVCTD
jgi:hypothetical protein